MPLTIPDYIEVRTAAGNLAAYLSPQDGLTDCEADARLNSESILTFRLPVTSEKWADIVPECRIRAGGREYAILRPDAIDTVRDDKGSLWGKVMAQENWILLDKQFPTVSNDPDDPTPAWGTVTIISGGAASGGYPAGSAGSALSYLLAGSGWTLGTCDVTGTHDLETDKESLLANIQKVQETWGGYLVWNSLTHTVSLRAESTWQNYTGFQVRYGKNLKHITRTANYDLTTRLYPFGEDDLDISSVNGGVKYLENFGYTSTILEGKYENQGIADAQELMDKATEVLAKICQPRYTYQVNVVDVRVLPEYNPEDFSLGDMADIIDEDPGFNVQVRIVRHKYNIFQPWKCELEIGEPEERLAAQLSKALDVTDYVSNQLKPNPSTSNLLKGVVDTFATIINSANGKLVWDDSTLEAIEIDGGGAETGNRVKLTPGGLGVSTDGGATYATAITGEGILANAVIVNALYALSTDDTYTQIKGDGLHVYDSAGHEMAILGHWTVSGTT
ncbi:MAG: phage tail spike protein, partial [Bacillota bacterium]